MVQHTIGRTNLNEKTQEKIDVMSMREYIGKKIFAVLCSDKSKVNFISQPAHQR